MPEFDEDRAHRFALLLETPAWVDLQEYVAEKREKWLVAQARQLLAGQPGVALEQSRLDYDRGWYAGAAALLEIPRRAREKLDQAIREESGGDN